MKKRMSLWITCTVLAWTSCTSAQVLRFAVLPEEPAAVSKQRFEPLLRYLETRGLTAIWITVPDQPALVEAVAAKRVDFAWMNGATFVQTRARMAGNLTPIAQRSEDAQYKSVIVTANDEVKALADLEGKSLMFGAKTSVAGHIMPRRFLLRDHPGLIEKLSAVRHAPTHEAVAYAVLRGAADAGALSEVSWERLVQEGRVDATKARVLFTTPTFFDYCFAIPADQDPALVTTLQNALIGLNPKQPDHANVLRALRATRVITASADNYAPLDEIMQALGLTK
jgi:phosphonate transport system substrate-binding protein